MVLSNSQEKMLEEISLSQNGMKLSKNSERVLRSDIRKKRTPELLKFLFFILKFNFNELDLEQQNTIIKDIFPRVRELQKLNNIENKKIYDFNTNISKKQIDAILYQIKLILDFDLFMLSETHPRQSSGPRSKNLITEDSFNFLMNEILPVLLILFQDHE